LCLILDPTPTLFPYVPLPQDYPEFLQLSFTPLLSQLTSTAPQFEESELHRLRHAVLEVLAKLPPTEKLQPYLPQLMQVRGTGSKAGVRTGLGVRCTSSCTLVKRHSSSSSRQCWHATAPLLSAKLQIHQ
jgi:hypothetical protein